MKFTRQRFQRGSLRKIARATNKWAWEYRYKDPTTGKDKSMYFGTDKFPTQIAMERHLQAFVLKLNAENPSLAVPDCTFNTLLDRFIDEAKLLEIKQLRPGHRSEGNEELSPSMVLSYLSVISRFQRDGERSRLPGSRPFRFRIG